jgi:hypothetical protein
MSFRRRVIQLQCFFRRRFGQRPHFRRCHPSLRYRSCVIVRQSTVCGCIRRIGADRFLKQFPAFRIVTRNPVNPVPERNRACAISWAAPPFHPASGPRAWPANGQGTATWTACPEAKPKGWLSSPAAIPLSSVTVDPSRAARLSPPKFPPRSPPGFASWHAHTLVLTYHRMIIDAPVTSALIKSQYSSNR